MDCEYIDENAINDLLKDLDNEDENDPEQQTDCNMEAEEDCNTDDELFSPPLFDIAYSPVLPRESLRPMSSSASKVLKPITKCCQFGESNVAKDTAPIVPRPVLTGRFDNSPKTCRKKAAKSEKIRFSSINISEAKRQMGGSVSGSNGASTKATCSRISNAGNKCMKTYHHPVSQMPNASHFIVPTNTVSQPQVTSVVEEFSDANKPYYEVSSKTDFESSFDLSSKISKASAFNAPWTGGISHNEPEHPSTSMATAVSQDKVTSREKPRVYGLVKSTKSDTDEGSDPNPMQGICHRLRKQFSRSMPQAGVATSQYSAPATMETSTTVRTNTEKIGISQVGRNPCTPFLTSNCKVATSSVPQTCGSLGARQSNTSPHTQVLNYPPQPNGGDPFSAFRRPCAAVKKTKSKLSPALRNKILYDEEPKPGNDFKASNQRPQASHVVQNVPAESDEMNALGLLLPNSLSTDPPVIPEDGMDLSGYFSALSQNSLSPFVKLQSAPPTNPPMTKYPTSFCISSPKISATSNTYHPPFVTHRKSSPKLSSAKYAQFQPSAKMETPSELWTADTSTKASGIWATKTEKMEWCAEYTASALPRDLPTCNSPHLCRSYALANPVACQGIAGDCHGYAPQGTTQSRSKWGQFMPTDCYESVERIHRKNWVRSVVNEEKRKMKHRSEEELISAIKLKCETFDREWIQQFESLTNLPPGLEAGSIVPQWLQDNKEYLTATTDLQRVVKHEELSQQHKPFITYASSNNCLPGTQLSKCIEKGCCPDTFIVSDPVHVLSNTDISLV